MTTVWVEKPETIFYCLPSGLVSESVRLQDSNVITGNLCYKKTLKMD